MIVQIQQAIRDSGLTLGELGRTTGVSAGQLSRFLRGERMLSLPATAKLCEALRLHLVAEQAQPPGPAATVTAARVVVVAGSPAAGAAERQGAAEEGEGEVTTTPTTAVHRGRHSLMEGVTHD
jgi:transcriptional regulator with XRE-family HTH domain